MAGADTQQGHAVPRGRGCLAVSSKAVLPPSGSQGVLEEIWGQGEGQTIGEVLPFELSCIQSARHLQLWPIW